MINLNALKEAYESKTGFTVFLEEGELLDFYRKSNEIIMPVCGVFSFNPVSLTAIQKPFIGVLTANITFLASPDTWEDVRDKLNDVALELNGTSIKVGGTDENESYSVAYNCETCTVGDRILDVAAGVGEMFPITQLISYIIIEDGVSAYDARLCVDGYEIPILSMTENKIVASSVYADGHGTGGMAAETETYGIDFTTPYINGEACEIFREAINGFAGGKAHCVIVEKNGKRSGKIMQFGNVSNSISPPQNIGFNVSFVEAHPLSVDFDGRWADLEFDGDYATIVAAKNDGSITGRVIFWGDGCITEIDGEESNEYHIFTDGMKHHTVRVFTVGSKQTYLEKAAQTNGLLGATITVAKDIVLPPSNEGTISIAVGSGGVAIKLSEDGIILSLGGGTTINAVKGVMDYDGLTIKAGATFQMPMDGFDDILGGYAQTFLIDRAYVKTSVRRTSLEV